jgi:hypothetical protein
MSLRERLRKRVQPFLEADESADAVFLAQTGTKPLFAFLSPLIYSPDANNRIVAVSHRSVVVLGASTFGPIKPKRVKARLPRSTQLGPVSGLWSEVQLNGERLWVNRRFYSDIKEVDARRVAAAQRM